ncbi:MAG: LysR family transcriptional regulator [Bdellovibrionota bacterium]
MIDEIQALSALKKYGTLALAGVHLRVEASTVWKRIQNLERSYGKSLLEKKGRNAYLTPEAETLLRAAEPHVDALREALDGHENHESQSRPLRVGLSESIALSWGPKLLKNLTEAIPFSSFDLSTHRGSLLVEKLRHGDFDFVVCAGTSMSKSTLIGEKLFNEELLLYEVPEQKKVYCIEESALSFEWLKEDAKTLLSSLQKKYALTPLQSYGAIASLISSGVAGGIVPLGIALRFKLPEKYLSRLQKKLYRPIYLYSKKGFYTSKVGNNIFDACKKISKKGAAYFNNPSSY